MKTIFVLFLKHIFIFVKKNWFPNKRCTSKSEKKMNQKTVPNWAKTETPKTRIGTKISTKNKNQKPHFYSANKAPSRRGTGTNFLGIWELIL